jgi:hypothetical protein
MQIGMIGLGRMGANMARRLLKREVISVWSSTGRQKSCKSWSRKKAVGSSSPRRLCAEANQAAGGVVDGSGGGRGRDHRRSPPRTLSAATFSSMAEIPTTWTTFAARRN